MAAGRGAIIVLPHMGNWDVSGLWFVERGFPFTTVAERLEPASLYDRFVAYRESLGMEVLALTGGERSPMEVLADRLRAGRAVCLVADRDLSRNGIEVQFFGEPTRMPGGPAMLAALTGAPVLPVGLWFTDDGWGHRVNPPIEAPTGRLREKVAAGTQAVADVFAREIAAHPADWHMLQPLWLADLPERPGTPRRVAGRPVPVTAAMRIGLVCPYSWDMPGGVQAHVARPRREAHRARPRRLGARPGDGDMPGLPPYVVLAGKAVPFPTTARWPTCSSGSCPPPGSGAGCATATSTWCTCTSRPRPACRCSPA